MINAEESILLLKKGTDPATRRPVYTVKRINGCSIHEGFIDQTVGGISNRDSVKKRTLNIRIPDVSDYIGEAAYSRQGKPAGKWCVTLQDSVIVLESEPESEIPATMYEDDANALAAAYGLHARVYRVREYSDNSRRGSSRVRHIRVVCE